MPVALEPTRYIGDDMVMPLKTPMAARAVGCSYYRIFELIRDDRLRAPEKDTSGDYLWWPADLARLRDALANPPPRRRKSVVPG